MPSYYRNTYLIRLEKLETKSSLHHALGLFSEVAHCYFLFHYKQTKELFLEAKKESEKIMNEVVGLNESPVMI